MATFALWALLAVILIVMALAWWTIGQTLWYGVPPAVVATLWKEAKCLFRRR